MQYAYVRIVSRTHWYIYMHIYIGSMWIRYPTFPCYILCADVCEVYVHVYIHVFLWKILLQKTGAAHELYSHLHVRQPQFPWASSIMCTCTYVCVCSSTVSMCTHTHTCNNIYNFTADIHRHVTPMCMHAVVYTWLSYGDQVMICCSYCVNTPLLPLFGPFVNPITSLPFFGASDEIWSRLFWPHFQTFCNLVMEILSNCLLILCVNPTQRK